MRSTQPEVDCRTLDILVIDDEPEIRECIREMLGGRGHHVRTAGSAREAAIMLSRGKVDLALIDVCMPRMDGLELAAMIRMTRPHVEIVFMTGGCPEDSELVVSKLRGQIIRKPFRLHAIEAVMERLTARKDSTGKVAIRG